MNGSVKSYILFTTPYCPSCPPVKDFVKKLPLEGSLIDASASDGSLKAVTFGVMSVPTMIFLGESNQELGRANNLSSIKSFLSD